MVRPALPSWARRGQACEGLSDMDSQALIRVCPKEDNSTGFFVAYFERSYEKESGYPPSTSLATVAEGDAGANASNDGGMQNTFVLEKPNQTNPTNVDATEGNLVSSSRLKKRRAKKARQRANAKRRKLTGEKVTQ